MRMKSVQKLTSFKPLDIKKNASGNEFWENSCSEKKQTNQQHRNLIFLIPLPFSYKCPFLPQPMKLYLQYFNYRPP